jgi:hypothetical protein
VEPTVVRFLICEYFEDFVFLICEYFEDFVIWNVDIVTTVRRRFDLGLQLSNFVIHVFWELGAMGLGAIDSISRLIESASFIFTPMPID